MDEDFSNPTSNSLRSISQFTTPSQKDTMDVIDRLLSLGPHYADPFVPVNMMEEETANLLDDLSTYTEMSFIHGHDLDMSESDNPYL